MICPHCGHEVERVSISQSTQDIVINTTALNPTVLGPSFCAGVPNPTTVEITSQPQYFPVRPNQTGRF